MYNTRASSGMQKARRGTPLHRSTAQSQTQRLSHNPITSCDAHLLEFCEVVVRCGHQELGFLFPPFAPRSRRLPAAPFPARRVFPRRLSLAAGSSTLRPYTRRLCPLAYLCSGVGWCVGRAKSGGVDGGPFFAGQNRPIPPYYTPLRERIT